MYIYIKYISKFCWRRLQALVRTCVHCFARWVMHVQLPSRSYEYYLSCCSIDQINRCCMLSELSLGARAAPACSEPKLTCISLLFSLLLLHTWKHPLDRPSSVFDRPKGYVLHVLLGHYIESCTSTVRPGYKLNSSQFRTNFGQPPSSEINEPMILKLYSLC